MRKPPRRCCITPGARASTRLDEVNRSLAGAGFGCESAAHLVFGDGARKEELQQVVRAAGLRADAAELEPAERLPVHQRAGAFAVDVQVADAESALHLFEIAGA